MNTAVALATPQMQLACVYVGSMLCGFDISYVQEIKKYGQVTNVPMSPEHIHGIMNLRGQIVTLIDLNVKLDLPANRNEQRKIVITSWENEQMGFLVDEVADVWTIRKEKIKAPPSNIKGAQGRYFQGIYHAEAELIGIIDMAAAVS